MQNKYSQKKADENSFAFLYALGRKFYPPNFSA